ncbi:MAG: ABC transporter ATP-binding protein [Clostridiales bacterium]|nr:ABC transporter ATP-binding protein [Clostridiales bacterium]
MLKIDGLEVFYGYVNALRGISLEVHQGEIVTLIGSNGAGKTTTLMSVSGLAPKSAGTVRFRDRDITRMPPNKIVHLGIAHVPEGRKIFPGISVRDNLRAGALGNRGLTKKRVEELYEEVFELFPRLRERQKQAGGSLSGGEQQMLAIARGLMMDPELLMLDEPSLGLAPIVVEEIFSLLMRVHSLGKTILLIEQNASMALSIADRGYVLETGNIALEGAGKELLRNPEVQRVYLGG